MNKIAALGLSGILAFGAGCAQIKETTQKIWGSSVEVTKVVWGSSTKALEDARPDGLKKTFRCRYGDCFDAVLSLARRKPVDSKAPESAAMLSGESTDEPPKEPTDEFFDVFIKNRAKHHMVVMGVKGNTNTTEVGIFFSELGDQTTKIEITSLSSAAKRKVAQTVFDQLSLRFSEAP